MNILAKYCPKCGHLYRTMQQLDKNDRCRTCGVILSTQQLYHEWTSERELNRHLKELRKSWVETTNYVI